MDAEIQTPDSNSIKILLIEDNPGDADLIEEMLSRADVRFELKCVERLSAGIEQCKAYDFDVILLDLGLPDSRGLDTLVRFKECRPKAPVIVLTGLTDEKVGTEAVKAGAQDYLIKGQTDMKLLVRSITYAIERTQVEAEREQYFKFFRTSTDLMCFADPNGAFIKTNPAFSETLGYSETELLSRPFIEFVHPEDKQTTRDEMAIQLQKGYTINFENRYICKDGSLRWLSWRAIYNQDEGITYATARDITKQKQAEDALQRSEEFNRNILESVDEGFIVIDRDYRIISANRAFTEQTGMALAEITGRLCFEISHHCTAPCYEEGEMCAVKQVFDTGETRSVMHTHYDAEGAPLHVETKAYPLSKDESGKVMTVIEVIVDITEKKKAEERLKLLNECFLEFGPDPMENINRLVALCGKFMGATCALYNRIEDGRLCSWGQWNVPADYNPVDAPEGHICFDVIKDGSREVVVIRNLPETVYARTDPNVARYNLQTYVGTAVKFADTYVGSLCVVYQKDFLPGEDDKRIMGIIASAIATEEKRKKAEEAVKAAAREWSESFDAMADGVSILSADYTIMNVNQSLCRLLRKTPEELIGRKCYQIFHEKDCPIAACPLAGPKGRSQKEYNEIYEPTLNKWLAVSTSPVLDEAGSLTKIVHTVRDITERRQSEEELKKLAHKISLILNSTGEGIYGVDMDGKVTFINPAGARMLGYEAEELLGRQSHETWHHHNPDGTALSVDQCSLTKVLKEGTPGAAENVVFWRKDGTQFPVEFTSTPMVEADKLIGAVVTFRDISSQLIEAQEKKKLEDQLRHSQKMEAVGTLAGGIAHDFNNMLNVIIGFGTMVSDRIGDDPVLKEQMNEVLTAAERAVNLTKRLLVFSRKQVVEVRPVNINDTILDLKKMLARIIRENIELDLDLAEGQLQVMADAGQIEQVLMNLASNARDAMPEGGRLTIGTGLKVMDEEYVAAYGYGKPGKYVLIRVADTGQGMDEETKNKIFEPFFTTKAIGEGTGLGLAISYGIIKKHDGYINVYSEPGKGTEFKIYLPLIEEEAAQEIQTAAIVPARGGNETILLAEDDASLRKLERIVLESYGYTVITAEDGEEAIIKFMDNRERISLALIDMIMPKKNGKEVAEAIRTVSPDTKILFASGYTMDIIMTKELTEAGFDFILKPVLPKDLLKKVREILDK
ncbi:MAG: PAS domain-containing hybrid sensor histidine kinase/response regulator [Thermodesulfovibrionales bacterium]